MTTLLHVVLLAAGYVGKYALLKKLKTLYIRIRLKLIIINLNNIIMLLNHLLQSLSYRPTRIMNSKSELHR